MKHVILDIEANGLKPDRIWCIVCLDIDTKEIKTFHPNTPYGKHEDWLDDFKNYIKDCDKVIGHNLIGYDIVWIEKLLGIKIPLSKVVDTLILSRLFRPTPVFKHKIKELPRGFDSRIGGHSLEAWGLRLGYPKTEFNDWECFSQEMLEYCINDVKVNFEMYKTLLLEQEGFSDLSISIEHRVAYWLRLQEDNGFFLDKKQCIELRDECSELLEKMTNVLQESFPPMRKLKRTYQVKYNKDGSMNSVSKRILKEHKENPYLDIEYNKDTDEYSLYILEVFNPKSSVQIRKRLLSIGWEPKEFTDKGNPKTDKETLSKALDSLIESNPDLQGLKYLKNYNIIADRLQKAEKWLELVEEDGRVHGRINPIGAGTHRCSHYNDNMANIASVSSGSCSIDDIKMDTSDWKENPPKKFTKIDEDKLFLSLENDTVKYIKKGLSGNFGWESRNCWSVPSKDLCLVGADASGIQLRGLAHYMNDPEYIKEVIHGDIHKVNQIAAGIDTRAKAKTFIYAWLLGAGDEKRGTIVGVDKSEYNDLFKWAKNQYINNYHNVKGYTANNLYCFVIASIIKQNRKLTKNLAATIIKGYKVDKQFLERTPALKHLKEVVIPEATKKGYVVGLDGRKLWIPSLHLAMSLYLQGYEAVIMKLATILFNQKLNSLNIPYKQVAFVHDEWCVETPQEYGDKVGKTMVEAIRKAGILLKSNCPLDGEYLVGRSWAEVH